ncbi:hypothetical protein [Numidum massiliense]|uniref:hypothetical protein n=1 Tax=Numidum massiliense TaxID=1522315 RepID=UPI0006D5AE0E|nr:hypothetical protein [Numidum massiliense]
MAHKHSGSYAFGVILVILGAMMLLGQFGIGIGSLLMFAIALFLIVKGWGMLNSSGGGARRMLGIFLIVFGVLWMTGLLPFLFGLAIAVLLIYYGWGKIKGSAKDVAPASAHSSYAGDSGMFGHNGDGEAYDRHWYAGNDYGQPRRGHRPAGDDLDDWERDVRRRDRDY